MSIHHHATQVFVAFFNWWKTIGKSLVLLRRNRILCRFFEAVPQHPGTNSQTVCHLRHPSPKNATESPVQFFFHQKIVPWIWKLLFSEKPMLLFSTVRFIGCWMHLGPINPSMGNRFVSTGNRPWFCFHPRTASWNFLQNVQGTLVVSNDQLP